MSNLNSSINVAVGGASIFLGSGTKGTKAFFKEARELWLTPQGYTFDGATDFTDEYVAELVADGKIIVLEQIASVEEDKSENAYEDIGRGVMVLDTEGLYGFKFRFIKGMYNQQILKSLSGNGVFDMLVVDGTGKVMGTLAQDGTSLKGFTLGVHQVELLEGILSKNTAREIFKVQLLETAEMSNPAIKYADDDFNGLNASPVNEIKIEFVNTPSDTDTSVTIKATYKQGGEAFTGATFGQWNVKINGATANPTAGDDSATAGTYILTGITAISTGDSVAVSLYDNANSRAGIVVGGFIYKSATITATAVA